MVNLINNEGGSISKTTLQEIERCLDIEERLSLAKKYFIENATGSEVNTCTEEFGYLPTYLINERELYSICELCGIKTRVRHSVGHPLFFSSDFGNIENSRMGILHKLGIKKIDTPKIVSNDPTVWVLNPDSYMDPKKVSTFAFVNL